MDTYVVRAVANMPEVRLVTVTDTVLLELREGAATSDGRGGQKRLFSG